MSPRADERALTRGGQAVRLPAYSPTALGTAVLLSLLLASPAANSQHPPPRSPIVVGLPVPQVDSTGRLILRPNVAGTPYSAPPAINEQPAAEWPVAPATAALQDELPPPLLGFPGEPLSLLSGEPSDIWLSGEPLVPWDEIQYCCKEFIDRPRSPTGDPGLGRERVMYAPFEIDITQPFGNFLWRTQAAYNLTKPDRAEAFWARPGRGPLLPESGVDYQEFRLRMETGNDVFSLATDVPIRLVNPEINGNTGGVGDIEMVQKTVLIDGSRWQMTQLLRTTFNSGSAKKGLGTGHVAMEPGVLWRFKYTELTYFHSELKMTFPLGGTPMYSGPLLKWGLGVSHVWYETDTTAYLPTLEFTNIWVLDGQFIPFPSGVPVDIDGDGIFHLSPGLRIVHDTGGDLGVVELGTNAVFVVGSDGWYDALVRFDLRFVF